MTEVSYGPEAQQFRDLTEQTYDVARQYYKMLSDQRIQNQGQGKDQEVIDSLRLSLNLNYAVFLYEVKAEKKKALRILKKEIQEALDDFEKWDHNQIE